LVAAMMANFQDIVHLFIEHGADINSNIDDIHSALQFAQRQGYEKIAELIQAEQNKFTPDLIIRSIR
jgi:ankyrin repeat protein